MNLYFENGNECFNVSNVSTLGCAGARQHHKLRAEGAEAPHVVRDSGHLGEQTRPVPAPLHPQVREPEN